MQLDPLLQRVHEQFAAVASLGDDRTREIAHALSIAALPAVRLALLAAVSEIADEITAGLLDSPGSPGVSVRIDADDIEVEIRSEPVDQPSEPVYGDGESTARISLRLTDALKRGIDSAAERDGVSVNAWLVRAANDALRSSAGAGPSANTARGRRENHHRVTGWING
jgi:hypothetical protein